MKKKYTVEISVTVSVEIYSEEWSRVREDAVDIILGGLNSVEGIRAEKNFPPAIVKVEGDD